MYLVYAIVDEKEQFCKVGFSQLTKLNKRISDIQVGCPLKLYLLGFRIEVEKWHATRVELAFHHRFKRSRTSGEWFNFKNKDVKEAVHALIEISGAKLQQTIDAHKLELDSLN